MPKADRTFYSLLAALWLLIVTFCVVVLLKYSMLYTSVTLAQVHAFLTVTVGLLAGFAPFSKDNDLPAPYWVVTAE